MTAIAEPSTELPDLGATVHEIVKRLPGPLRRVKVQYEGHVVEVEWNHDLVTGVPLAAVPVSAPSVPVLDCEPGVGTGPAVTAPVVGTFYLRPSPEAAPFVAVGDEVEAGQQVGLIETMKLFTPVTAEQSGRVTAICVTDGEMVEYGQRLFDLDLGE